MVAAIDPVIVRERYTVERVFALLDEYHALRDRLHDERDDDMPRAKGPKPHHDGMPPRLPDKVNIDCALRWLRSLRNDPQAADAVEQFYIDIPRKSIGQVARWQGGTETQAFMVIYRGVCAMAKHMNGYR